MNTQEFFEQLDSKFDNLIHSDAKKLLEYFKELIADKTEDGLNEEDIIASFGDVDTIAQDLIAELNQPLLNNNQDVKNKLIKCKYDKNEVSSINLKLLSGDLIIEHSLDNNVCIEYSSLSNSLTYENNIINIIENTSDSSITKQTIQNFGSTTITTNNVNIEDIKIKLPKDCDIKFDIETISGDIAVNNTEANLINFNTKSGDFTINNSEVNLINFDSKSGDYVINNSIFKNEVILKSTSGDFSIKNSTFENNVNIKTTSGDIKTIDINVYKDINAKTTSGDCDIVIKGNPGDFYGINSTKTIETSSISDEVTIKFVD